MFMLLIEGILKENKKVLISKTFFFVISFLKILQVIRIKKDEEEKRKKNYLR